MFLEHDHAASRVITRTCPGVTTCFWDLFMCTGVLGAPCSMDIIGHKYERFVQQQLQRRAASARKEVGGEEKLRSCSSMQLPCLWHVRHAFILRSLGWLSALPLSLAKAQMHKCCACNQQLGHSLLSCTHEGPCHISHVTDCWLHRVTVCVRY